MEEPTKQSKLSIDLKQTSRGFWYIGALKVNAENIEEFDNLLLQASKKSTERLMRLNNEKDETNKEEAEVELNAGEQKLFQNFRELRLILAKKEGFPPYVIFHDSILKKIIKEKPKSAEDLIAIIGDKKFGKYGELVMELLQKYKSD